MTSGDERLTASGAMGEREAGAEHPAPRSRFRGRAAWGLGDQALSSLTNFLLSVSIARTVSAREFGAFVLAFAAYALVLNVVNGVIGEPLLVRCTNLPIEAWRRAAGAATGAALSLGLLCGAAALLLGWAVHGSQRAAFLGLAAALPGLALQDTWRKLFFAQLRGKLAFFTDLIWFAAFLLTLAIIVATGRESVFSLMGAWGAAGTVAAFAGCRQARVRPQVLRTRRWLRDHRDLARRYSAEQLLLSGTQQAAIYLIGAIAGLAVVGAVRGAEVVLGPVYVMVIGVRMMAVPETIVLLRKSPTRMRRRLVVLALGLSASAVGLGLLASLVPETLGRRLLGATWEGAQSALIPMAVVMAATAASMSGLLGLRALGAASRRLRARLYGAPLVCAGATVGASLGTIRAAAWGTAAGMSLGVVNWWRQLDLALEEHGRANADEDGGDLRARGT